MVYYSMNKMSVWQQYAARAKPNGMASGRFLDTDCFAGSNPVTLPTLKFLRGRLGSTRKTKRGLGCNTDSSTNSEGIIEGKMSVNSLSDLSPLQTFAGQRNNTGATVLVTPRSGDSKAYWPVSAPSNTAPHCYRNLNPCAEKGMHTRSQHYLFGGGATRMQMRAASKIGGSMK
jgi:hypothetical protein